MKEGNGHIYLWCDSDGEMFERNDIETNEKQTFMNLELLKDGKGRRQCV